MTEPPRISVVVTAFHRRKYLKGAVASVLNQTFPRERFETIVFKNFDDPDIEAYLNANHVRHITSKPEARPRTMRRVVEESKGEIICFIDDDDLFTPEKLAFVDRVFTEDPSLGFFHNDFVVIDETGRPFERSPFSQIGPGVYIRAGDGRRRPVPRNALRLGFNSSSVSIRRSWLTTFLPYFELPQAEWSDALLLCCALLSGYSVLAGPAKLTCYRYHDSWSNIVQYSLDTVSRIASMDDRNTDVLVLMEELTSDTPLEPLVREDLTYLRFHRSLFSDRDDWTPRPRDFIGFVRGGLHQRNYSAFYLIPLHVLSKISRVEARKAYFRLAARFRQVSFQKSASS